MATAEVLAEEAPPDAEPEEEEATEGPPPEDPDAPGPGTTEELPPEPEQAEARSEKEIEQAWKRAEKAATTYRNALSRHLGETANSLYTCPMCDPRTPGYFDGALVDDPPDETRKRLFAALVAPDTPDYQTADHVRTCLKCHGWGLLKSGSKLDAHALISCPQCKGVGFENTTTNTGTNGDAVTFTPSAVSTSTDTMPTTDPDAFGHPKLLADGTPNPNYGKMPWELDSRFP